MIGSQLMKLFGGGSPSGAVDVLSKTYKSTTDHIEVRIDADGFVYYKKDSGGSFIQDYAWITPQTGMDQYDVRATLAAGTPPDEGTLGSWENLGTDRVWGFPGPTSPDSCDLNIEIRLSSGGVVIDTAVLKLRIVEVIDPTDTR